MGIKTHKRRKHSRIRGARTIGWGARKKHKLSGQRGGKGMAGTGKRADQKKTLVQKLYGNKYFGKQGITSKGTQKNKDLKINVGSIQSSLGTLLKKNIAKKTSKGYELNLEKYIILGEGEVKEKLIIQAKKASENAVKKIEKLGGKIFLSTHLGKDNEQDVSIKKAGGKNKNESEKSV